MNTITIWTQPNLCTLNGNCMQVERLGEYYVVRNEYFWVKSVFPHVTFTTSEHEAMRCFTQTEADSIQEYIEMRFSA